MNRTGADDERTAARRLLLFTLFSAELAVISLVRRPDSFEFDRFAFCDSGTNLTLQYLVAHGLRPQIDFGYTYGLLPLLLGRVWFAAFGLSPNAYVALMYVCGIAMAWALATIAARLAFRTFDLAIFAIALGFAVQTSYPSLAQALEAVLLSIALAEQSTGHRRFALSFAAAAIFSKPSMGYLYSLVLLSFGALELRRGKARRSEFARLLTPAAVTIALLFLVLATTYGSASLVLTLLPTGGAANYRASKFGFFNASGRRFWDPHFVPSIFYLIDFSGFWIVATLFLIGAGVVAGMSLLVAAQDSHSRIFRRNELILTCALLHISFVLLFFGNQSSWVYYSYMLVIGVAVALNADAPSRRFALPLCIMAVLSWTDISLGLHRLWQIWRPDPIIESSCRRKSIAWSVNCRPPRLRSGPPEPMSAHRGQSLTSLMRRSPSLRQHSRGSTSKFSAVAQLSKDPGEL